MAETLSAVKVGGKIVSVSSSFTRPANTTAYTLGDVVSNSAAITVLMAFQNAASGCGGSGIISRAKLLTSQAANVAAYRVILYSRHENNVTVAVDNAAATTLYADRAALVGQIDLPAASAEAGTNTAAISYTDAIRVPFTCQESSRDLYALLIAKTAFTPDSAQTFYLELGVEQN